MKKRKKRMNAQETEQQVRLCKEQLFSDWKDYMVGESLPGIRAISEKYHYSLCVVRKVIDELKTESVVICNPREAMKLNKIPNAPPTLQGTKIAYILYQELSHPRSGFNSNVAAGQSFENKLSSQGGSLIYLNLWNGKKTDPCAQIIDLLKNDRFQAVMLFAKDNDHKFDLRDIHAYLKKLNIPVLMIGETDPDFHSIVFDDYACGETTAEYLIGLGHKHVAVVHFPEKKWSRERLDGFCNIMKKHHLPKPDIWEFPYFPDIINLSDTFDRRVDRVSAVFCVNDMLALQIKSLADQRNIAIPQRLSVIGCDDLGSARLCNLTTNARTYLNVGEAAFDLIKDLLLNPKQNRKKQHIKLKSPLIIRLTTDIAPDYFQ